ncbi:MAG: transporter substrate-binding domain-containing protein [Desulfobacteraceae bacterium]|nr:transporter substrate-binding domain-containing protein [Desulfobacteraceae bacterium]
MKKQFCLVCISIFLFFGTPLFAETIQMGFFQLKPHAFSEDNSTKPIGASIDYFNILAGKMGYDVSWEGPIPFQRLIKRLREGTLDGSILFLKTPPRENFLYYSNSYIFKLKTIFAVKKNNPLNKIESINDVKDYRVGFLKGGRTSPFITNNLDKLIMELMPGKTWVEQNLLKLKAERLDAVYDLNQYTLKYVMHKMKLQDNFKILIVPEEPNPVYPIFSKASPKGKKLHQQCNEVVKTYSHNYDDFIIDFLN